MATPLAHKSAGPKGSTYINYLIEPELFAQAKCFFVRNFSATALTIGTWYKLLVLTASGNFGIGYLLRGTVGRS